MGTVEQLLTKHGLTERKGQGEEGGASKNEEDESGGPSFQWSGDCLRLAKAIVGIPSSPLASCQVLFVFTRGHPPLPPLPHLASQGDREESPRFIRCRDTTAAFQECLDMARQQPDVHFDVLVTGSLLQAGSVLEVCKFDV